MVFSPAKLAVVALALVQAAVAEDLFGVVGKRSDLSQIGAVLKSKPELVKTLGASGKITLLAPSDSAIQKFTAQNGELSSLDANLVDKVLAYHALSGAAKSTDLNVPRGAIAKTFVAEPKLGENENQVLYASAYGSSGLAKEAGSLKVYSGLGQSSSVVADGADIEFDGGVVHIIDTVLTLPENVTSTAFKAGLKTLVTAVEIAGLGETLDNTPKLTVFAPTDEAFAAINVGGDTPKDDITKALARHVITNTVGYSTILEDGQEFETFGGETIKVTVKDGEVWVNNAKVVIANVLTENGVVHVIDSVILPANTTGNGTASPTPSPTGGADSAAGKVGAATFLVGLAVGISAFAQLF